MSTSNSVNRLCDIRNTQGLVILQVFLLEINILENVKVLPWSAHKSDMGTKLQLTKQKNNNNNKTKPWHCYKPKPKPNPRPQHVNEFLNTLNVHLTLAHMRRFLSVLWTGPQIGENNSYLKKYSS